MTKQISTSILRGVFLGALAIGLANPADAASTPDFSGSYQLQVHKSDKIAGGEVHLEVMQSDKSVEVTKATSDKRETTVYPLNGTDGEYKSPGGVPGRCKAQIRGNNLILETMVVTHPDPSARPVRVHTKELWQLSADLKTLIVKTSEDFPDAPAGISNLVESSLGDTEKYIRVQTP